MGSPTPLNWLRSFEAAARHSSFTQAARELNITQAAVSKQIKALESSLNCQLFHRHAHGLDLTEQGRRYWRDTRDSIYKLDKITTQFVNRQQRNRIHIRCNISYGALVLPHLLQEFRMQYPDINIEMTHDIWEPEQHSDNAHIEIGYRPLEDIQSSTTTKLLATGLLFPVVAKHITKNDLASLPLIHVKGYYREWSWWLEQIQSIEQNEVLQSLRLRRNSRYACSDWFVDNSLTAYQLSSQGLGVALGRECLVRDYLHKGDLQRLENCPGLDAQEGFVMHLSSQGQGHQAAEKLFALLLENAL